MQRFRYYKPRQRGKPGAWMLNVALAFAICGLGVAVVTM